MRVQVRDVQVNYGAVLTFVYGDIHLVQGEKNANTETS